jgi:hypothetical protein
VPKVWARLWPADAIRLSNCWGLRIECQGSSAARMGAARLILPPLVRRLATGGPSTGDPSHYGVFHEEWTLVWRAKQ